MTATAMEHPGDCEECDTPQGGYICRACANDGRELDLRAWLLRKKTVYPGLTNDQVALIEELIRDFESETL